MHRCPQSHCCKYATWVNRGLIRENKVLPFCMRVCERAQTHTSVWVRARSCACMHACWEARASERQTSEENNECARTYARTHARTCDRFPLYPSLMCSYRVVQETALFSRLEETGGNDETPCTKSSEWTRNDENEMRELQPTRRLADDGCTAHSAQEPHTNDAGHVSSGR